MKVKVTIQTRQRMRVKAKAMMKTRLRTGARAHHRSALTDGQVEEAALLPLQS